MLRHLVDSPLYAPTASQESTLSAKATSTETLHTSPLFAEKVSATGHVDVSGTGGKKAARGACRTRPGRPADRHARTRRSPTHRSLAPTLL